MPISVHTDNLSDLVAGLSGIVEDLSGISAHLRGGDAESAGYGRLIDATAEFNSRWGAGFETLGNALREVSTRLAAAAAAYEQADAAVSTSMHT